MEYKLTVEINTERPINADLDDNDKIKGFVEYLVSQGYVVPESVEIDPASGTAKIKVTEQLIQFIEKYLG